MIKCKQDFNESARILHIPLGKVDDIQQGMKNLEQSINWMKNAS